MTNTSTPHQHKLTHLDDSLLLAYIEGKLNVEQQAAVDAFLAEHPFEAAAVAGLKQLEDKSILPGLISQLQHQLQRQIKQKQKRQSRRKLTDWSYLWWGGIVLLVVLLAAAYLIFKLKA